MIGGLIREVRAEEEAARKRLYDEGYEAGVKAVLVLAEKYNVPKLVEAIKTLLDKK